MAIVRAQDAFNAKESLAKHPFVDSSRIAVMGWSHGGWTVLKALNGSQCGMKSVVAPQRVVLLQHTEQHFGCRGLQILCLEEVGSDLDQHAE